MWRNNRKTREKQKNLVIERKINGAKKNTFLFKKWKQSRNEEHWVIYRRQNTFVKQLVDESRKESSQK